MGAWNAMRAPAPRHMPLTPSDLHLTHTTTTPVHKDDSHAYGHPHAYTHGHNAHDMRSSPTGSSGPGHEQSFGTQSPQRQREGGPTPGLRLREQRQPPPHVAPAPTKRFTERLRARSANGCVPQPKQSAQDWYSTATSHTCRRSFTMSKGLVINDARAPAAAPLHNTHTHTHTKTSHSQT